jgi:hypothetical protein
MQVVHSAAGLLQVGRFYVCWWDLNQMIYNFPYECFFPPDRDGHIFFCIFFQLLSSVVEKYKQEDGIKQSHEQLNTNMR